MACSLRVFNEYYSPFNASTTVNITGLGYGSPFSVPPLIPGAYMPIPCTTGNLTITPLASGVDPLTLPVDTTGADSSHYTLLVRKAHSATKNTVHASLLTDVDRAPTTGIDNAQFRVINALPMTVDLFGVVSECYDCALPKFNGEEGGSLDPGSVLQTVPTTQYPWTLRAWPASEGASTVTSLPLPGSPSLHSFTLQEYGVYTFILHPDGTSSFVEDIAGRNANLPLLFYVLGMVVLGVVHKAIGALLVAGARQSRKAPPPRAKGGAITLTAFFGYDTLMQRAVAELEKEDGGDGEEDDNDLSSGLLQGGATAGSLQEAPTAPAGASKKSSSATSGAPKAPRVLSLDTFRGFALCIMMLANFGGGRYSFLDHSKWNGLTVADLLFPWFIFMSGVSMGLSQASEARRGSTMKDKVMKTLVRSGKLVFLGVFMVNNGLYMPGLRVYSVLGYFAATNLVLGLVDALLPPLSPSPTTHPDTLAAAFYADTGRYAAQWGAMGGLASLYLLLTFFLPVPGCPTGYIGPGGLANQGAHPPHCVGGASSYIDNSLFGKAHVYQNPTCVDVYQCGAHDPEGLLGGMMACWMAWLGLWAGRVFVSQKALMGGGQQGGFRHLAKKLAMRWVPMGLLLLLTAGLLCGFSKESGIIPVNKNLWSPSFIALLSGWGHLILTFLFYVVDVNGWWSGAPFRYLGENSLPVYLVSELLDGQFPLRTYFTKSGDWVSHTEALGSNLLGIAALCVLARYWNLTGFSWNV